MKKLTFSLLAFAAFFALTVACTKEPIAYKSSDVVGLWQKANSNEYWRYTSDGKGNFWDEDEDVHEGEGTHFRWKVDVDQLQITFTGQMGQEVPRDYKIDELTASLMRLEDELYGTKTTYYKK